MTTVHVSGVPSHIKLRKLIYIFKTVLRKSGAPDDFWINQMEDIRGTYLKSLKMEFYSPSDAYDAVTILDGYELVEAEQPLTARIDDDVLLRTRSPSPRRHRSRERYYDDYRRRDEYGHGRYSRDRSRSPIHREASKLDMEIELLRKQRMIIEEERRLIMERKKLELVKEFGPSAVRDFRSLDKERDKRYRPARSPDYRPRRASPPRRQPRSESFQDRPARTRLHKKLPQFVLPCKILIKQMKELIEKHEQGSDVSLLTKLMKNTMRKRMAVALEGQPILSGAKIVAVYREKYPQNLDVDFVLQHVKEMKSLHIPGKGGNSAKGSAGSSKENEDEKTATNRKQETDSSTTDDANVKVEPKNASNTTIPEPKSEGDLAEDNQKPESEGLADEEPRVEPASEGNVELEKREEGSMGSSDAIALHDKNDEDWVQGEQGWTSDTV